MTGYRQAIFSPKVRFFNGNLTYEFQHDGDVAKGAFGFSVGNEDLIANFKKHLLHKLTSYLSSPDTQLTALLETDDPDKRWFVHCAKSQLSDTSGRPVRSIWVIEIPNDDVKNAGLCSVLDLATRVIPLRADGKELPGISKEPPSPIGYKYEQPLHTLPHSNYQISSLEVNLQQTFSKTLACLMARPYNPGTLNLNAHSFGGTHTHGDLIKILKNISLCVPFDFLNTFAAVSNGQSSIEFIDCDLILYNRDLSHSSLSKTSAIYAWVYAEYVTSCLSRESLKKLIQEEIHQWKGGSKEQDIQNWVLQQCAKNLEIFEPKIELVARIVFGAQILNAHMNDIKELNDIKEYYSQLISYLNSLSQNVRKQAYKQAREYVDEKQYRQLAGVLNIDYDAFEEKEPRPRQQSDLDHRQATRKFFLIGLSVGCTVVFIISLLAFLISSKTNANNSSIDINATKLIDLNSTIAYVQAEKDEQNITINTYNRNATKTAAMAEETEKAQVVVQATHVALNSTVFAYNATATQHSFATATASSIIPTSTSPSHDISFFTSGCELIASTPGPVLMESPSQNSQQIGQTQMEPQRGNVFAIARSNVPYLDGYRQGLWLYTRFWFDGEPSRSSEGWARTDGNALTGTCTELDLWLFTETQAQPSTLANYGKFLLEDGDDLFVYGSIDLPFVALANQVVTVNCSPADQCSAVKIIFPSGDEEKHGSGEPFTFSASCPNCTLHLDTTTDASRPTLITFLLN
ncbi:MAG: hypothetical protein JW725_00325 [Candidatus Babeliaceae bacterium]|nr:hypothetical protein [Candidatus Babeliaceae bacterium]